MPEQTIFKLKRTIGNLNKGDHVVIIAAAKLCCGCKFLIKKVDEDIFQNCTDEDLKKVK
jgi:hypothetical protein